MKKLLKWLGSLAITSGVMPNIVATCSYQNKEKHPDLYQHEIAIATNGPVYKITFFLNDDLFYESSEHNCEKGLMPIQKEVTLKTYYYVRDLTVILNNKHYLTFGDYINDEDELESKQQELTFSTQTYAYMLSVTLNDKAYSKPLDEDIYEDDFY